MKTTSYRMLPLSTRCQRLLFWFGSFGLLWDLPPARSKTGHLAFALSLHPCLGLRGSKTGWETHNNSVLASLGPPLWSQCGAPRSPDSQGSSLRTRVRGFPACTRLLVPSPEGLHLLALLQWCSEWLPSLAHTEVQAQCLQQPRSRWCSFLTWGCTLQIWAYLRKKAHSWTQGRFALPKPKSCAGNVEPL